MSSSDSSYFDMFISSIVLRENCYQCKYANEKRLRSMDFPDPASAVITAKSWRE